MKLFDSRHLLCLCFCTFFATTGCDGDTPGHATTGQNDEHETADHHAHGEHADEVKLTADAIRQSGIRSEPAVKRSLLPTLTAPGHVTFNSEAMAHVGSLVRGRIVELSVRVGDTVREGDDLLTVESTELGEAQSEYLQRRAGASVADGAIHPLQNAYERSKSLYDETGGIALGEVQKREAEFLSAKGALATQTTASAAARDKLLLLGMSEPNVLELETSGKLSPRIVIRAPISGRVIEREVTMGELVSPDKEKLLVLADLSTLWVIAQVPESRLGEIKPGGTATVQVATSKERLPGTVSHIAAELDAGTRTGRVRIQLENGKGDARPGMFARVELELDAGPGGMTEGVAVPADAVQNVEGGTVVFVPVEGEENTFATRNVSVGPAVGDMVPILSGVKVGEPVVVYGAFLLKAELGKSGAAHEH